MSTRFVDRTHRTTDGEVIAYRSFGSTDDPTIVLMHGTGLSQIMWRGLGYVDVLLPHFRVITIDVLGHGRSSKPVDPGRFALRELASDIESVLVQEGVDAAHYLGYSLGAVIGFTLLDRIPDRMLSLTAVAGTDRPSAVAASKILFPDAPQLLADSGMQRFIEEWERARGRAVDASTASALRANNPGALAALLAALDSETGLSDAQLRRSEVPVLTIAGDQDPVLNDSKRLAALLPNARHVTLSGHDHSTIMQERESIVRALHHLVARQLQAGL